MNKFIVLSCVDVEETDTKQYNGLTVVMAMLSDPSFMLFFPISKENADIINYVLDGQGTYDRNTNILGIYTTMLESWKASDRYLSGIVMDTVYDPSLQDDIMSVQLALSDREGVLDSVIKVNFVHALMLCVMERLPIIISNELLNKLLPEPLELSSDDIMYTSHKSSKEKQSTYPSDENILNIVKDIMEAGPPKPSNNTDIPKQKQQSDKTTKTTKTTKRKPRQKPKSTNKRKDNLE